MRGWGQWWGVGGGKRLVKCKGKLNFSRSPGLDQLHAFTCFSLILSKLPCPPPLDDKLFKWQGVFCLWYSVPDFSIQIVILKNVAYVFLSLLYFILFCFVFFSFFYFILRGPVSKRFNFTIIII